MANKFKLDQEVTVFYNTSDPYQAKIVTASQDFSADTDETGEAPWIYRVRYTVDDTLSGGWISENDITDDPGKHEITQLTPDEYQLVRDELELDVDSPTTQALKKLLKERDELFAHLLECCAQIENEWGCIKPPVLATWFEKNAD